MSITKKDVTERAESVVTLLKADNPKASNGLLDAMEECTKAKANKMRADSNLLRAQRNTELRAAQLEAEQMKKETNEETIFGLECSVVDANADLLEAEFAVTKADVLLAQAEAKMDELLATVNAK